MARTGKTEAARLAAFRKQLVEMPVEYLRCHAFGHKTEPMTINPGEGVFVIGLVCGSCGMEIDRVRDPYSGEVKSRYWPPNSDYYFKGTGRLTTEMKLEVEEAWRAVANLPERAD